MDFFKNFIDWFIQVVYNTTVSSYIIAASFYWQRKQEWFEETTDPMPVENVICCTLCNNDDKKCLLWFLMTYCVQIYFFRFIGWFYFFNQWKKQKTKNCCNQWQSNGKQSNINFFQQICIYFYTWSSEVCTFNYNLCFWEQMYQDSHVI